MTTLTKHKYSTYALILLMGLFVIGYAISGFTSGDVDELCNYNTSYLKRVSGTWICENITYGELYIPHKHDQAVSIAVQDVYYNISGMNQSGQFYKFNTDGNVLQPEESGIYLVNLMTSFSGGGSTEYDISLFVNGVQQLDCSMHRKMGTGGDVGSGGFTCLLSLSALDLVQAKVEDTNNPPADITIHAMNFNIIEVT